MVDKIKFAHLLLNISLLSGCSFIVKNQGAVGCDDGAPARCEDTTLVVCEGGFEARVACSDGCAAAPEAHCTVCGDAVTEAPEACDDGNNIVGDGCEPSCALSPDCGDGALQTAEQCDDGNNTSNDGCSSDCQLEFCGDGIKQTNEECDGEANCRTDCRITGGGAPACGDGLPDEGEACDDGNVRGGDGCSFDCAVAESCGNGVLDVNENCELTDAGCVSCLAFDSCGDGASDAGELCFETPGEELSVAGATTAGARFFSKQQDKSFFALTRSQGGNTLEVANLDADSVSVIASVSRGNPAVAMASGQRQVTSTNESFVGVESNKQVFLGGLSANNILLDADNVFSALPSPATIRQIELRDLTGDGVADLIVLEPQGLQMLSADCDPFCNVLTTLATPTVNPRRMAIAEMNNDNKPDVIVVSNGDATNEASIQVFLNNSPNPFTLGAELKVGIGGFSFVDVAVADFDKDNDIDIVVACNGNGNATDKLLVVANIGAANAPQLPNFGAATTPTIPVGGVGLSLLTTGDVDNDGNLDLIASTETSKDIVILQKAGALQSANAFSVLARYAIKNQPTVLAFDDLSGAPLKVLSLFAGGVEVLFSSF